MSALAAVTIPTVDDVGRAPASRRRSAAVMVIVRVVLAVAFAAAGFQKVLGTHYMVEMFAKIGVGQWLRYLIGGVEIAAAIGLLIPLLAGLAALGLTALMLGATVTNATVIRYNPGAPLTFMLLSGLAAWGLRAGTKSLLGGLHR